MEIYVHQRGAYIWGIVLYHNVSCSRVNNLQVDTVKYLIDNIKAP